MGGLTCCPMCGGARLGPPARDLPSPWPNRMARTWCCLVLLFQVPEPPAGGL